MGCSAISLKKEGWGNVKGTVEYRSPVCRARICRKSPLMFQHPSFILARRNNRHHFRVSSRVMPMPPGYTKVFGFAPTWCTKECLTRKCRAFFCCSILRRHDLVHRQGYSNRAAARSAVRNATVRRSLWKTARCFRRIISMKIKS